MLLFFNFFLVGIRKITDKKCHRKISPYKNKIGFSLICILGNRKVPTYIHIEYNLYKYSTYVQCVQNVGKFQILIFEYYCIILDH